MKRSKWLTVALVNIVLVAFTGDVCAQKGRSGGSSRSFGGSSRSSKPSSSSLFGGSSRSSKPSSSSLFGGSSRSSKPSATPPSSGPKFGSRSTNSSKSAASSSQKKVDSPKFGSPNTTPKGVVPKFGSPTSQGGSASPAGNSAQTISGKPSSGGGSAKAQAQKREESKRAYAVSQKATAPPKSTATVNGQTVKIDASSRSVSDLRSKPSAYIAPAARRTRYETHVVTHHYAHPYNYYYSRPVSYGIGPYSNAFWWMMMEWSAERRAQWLYHHQSELSAQAYSDALRDQEVQRRLADLEAQKVARNASYVDSEFATDPSDMYDQNYVEAAYNPTVASLNDSSGGFGFVLGVIALLIASVCLLAFLGTKIKVTD